MQGRYKMQGSCTYMRGGKMYTMLDPKMEPLYLARAVR